MEKKFDLKEVLDLSPEKIREFIGLGKENFELYQKDFQEFIERNSSPIEEKDPQMYVILYVWASSMIFNATRLGNADYLFVNSNTFEKMNDSMGPEEGECGKPCNTKWKFGRRLYTCSVIVCDELEDNEFLFGYIQRTEFSFFRNEEGKLYMKIKTPEEQNNLEKERFIDLKFQM